MQLDLNWLIANVFLLRVACQGIAGMSRASFLSFLERPVGPVFRVMYSKYTFWHILLVTMRERTYIKLDQSSFVAKKICYSWLELYLNNLSAGMDITLHC